MEKKSSPILIISVLTGILLVALVGMLVYFNLPAQRIRRMLKSANKYIAEENYDEAILTLQKMLEIDPKNEDIYVLLADTYEKNGDIDKEIEFLQEAVTLMPENRKISEVLTDVNPEVTISEAGGTYKDPISLTLDAPEDSKIYYIISGAGANDTNSADSSETGNKENEYSESITLGRNGKYSIEYYAVSKNGYEGEHKKGTYVIDLDESKYHFNGWVDEADGRHYYEADGKSATGWKKIGELWYLFDKSGVMLTGLQEDDGKTYYLGTDGIMRTGWQEINGKKYYFNDSGAMLKNQWIDDTYYVGADGAMLVDTETPDGKKVGKDGKYIAQTGSEDFSAPYIGIHYPNEELASDVRFTNDMLIDHGDFYEIPGQQVYFSVSTGYDVEYEYIYSGSIYVYKNAKMWEPGSWNNEGYDVEFQYCLDRRETDGSNEHKWVLVEPDSRGIFTTGGLFWAG
ncbi:tetratricopeptide repeat protein [Oribacterium sp. FC2011]|uniref:tetratricopeptide repeat protein n=1 Tax=Oribacterium sp. FC2011 TaxID=1408311 RepID=UPI00067902B3|nr:tetratricopeptide repeat protein [Oribacterium sp. FC2011]